MLIKPNVNPKGVIHVGGHRGEEQPWYDEIGVKRTLWIEAIPESAKWMEDHFSSREDIKVVQAALSDQAGLADFHITNNLASSSLLELAKHKEYHPKIHETSVIEVFTECLTDVFYNCTQESISHYDMLNIDVQGAEMKVLRGGRDLLWDMKWIYCEVNIEEIYKGCARLEDIEEYLDKFGFELKELEMTPYSWGDALFSK